MKGITVKERSKSEKARKDDERYARLMAGEEKKLPVKRSDWDTYLLSDT